MEGETKKLIRALLITAFFHNIGFNVWWNIFNNFAVESLSVRGDQIGFIQSIREIPGFLGFGVGILMLVMSEANIVGLSTLILGLGLAITGMAANYPTLLLGTLVMSTGFHYYYTANSSLLLMASQRGEGAGVLGKFRSLGGLASVMASVAVFFLVNRLGFRSLFYGAGVVSALSGLYMIFQRSKGAHLDKTRKVVFRRRYWLYYVLTFLGGSRRHILTTFAIFLLVSVYKVSAREISILFLANSIVSTLIYQRLGKAVDRIGERTVLSVSALISIPIFLGYAYLKNLPVLFAFFIADNIIFGFSIALETYFQKIAPNDEITSNVSMGTTINHVSAVFVPALGGFLWTKYGYHTTFLAGVGIVVLSLIFSLMVRVGPKEAPAVLRRAEAEARKA
jgi:predicted MFS family arabinose efflux permease